MFYMVWFKWLYFIPEGLQAFIVAIDVCFYIGSCAYRVEEGRARAQLFNGKYTGVAFLQGIGFTPRVPFPLVRLFVWLFLKKDICDYLGWTLKGDVSVSSISIEYRAYGQTSDGIAVELSGSFVLEIQNIANYLVQTFGQGGVEKLLPIIQAQASSQITKQVIARHTVLGLRSGELSGTTDPTAVWITAACNFVKEYGLELTSIPIVSVVITDERIRSIHNMHGANQLIAVNAKSFGVAFAEFKKANPKLDNEIAYALFTASLGGDTGGVAVGLGSLKLK